MSASRDVIPADLRLQLERRWPARLPPGESARILGWPIAKTIVSSAQRGEDLASIIMVTYNGIVLTKLCLTSVLINVRHPHYEVIVVDNASQDGTEGLLKAIAEANPHIRIVLNPANLGFAGAVNQGLAAARGDALVLLNSDTIVPPRCLETLLAHLRDGRTGLIGPLTNQSGTEAEITCRYRTYGEFLRFCEKRRKEYEGLSFETCMLSMFCLAMQRRTYDRLGPLDEQYGVGLFEDDDYSLRALTQGIQARCAEDCYVHHFGQGSFGEWGSAARYKELHRENLQRFERKWKMNWRVRRKRVSPEYEHLRLLIREVVQKHIPPYATTLMVSRGDEQLVEELGPGFRHFPQGSDGGYAGYYPQDDLACVAHLEELLSSGARFVVFPKTSLWWLDYYHGLREFLERDFSKIYDDPDIVVIYELRGP